MATRLTKGQNMVERTTETVLAVRPTKKQRELLTFIEHFIVEHGYSPSYREIMAGCDYTSVATVALHVNSLITRGHLRKREHSARSLEVVNPNEAAKLASNEIKPADEKWLIQKVEFYFVKLEQAAIVEQAQLDELYVLIGALKVLGLAGAAQSFIINCLVDRYGLWPVAKMPQEIIWQNKALQQTKGYNRGGRDEHYLFPVTVQPAGGASH